MQERKRVLIVDDESSVRESLQMILSRLYQVSVAEDGEEALTLLEAGAKPAVAKNGGQEGLPDLVLLDVMMPGLDGIGILEQLSEKYPQLPVVMLTASTTVRTAVEAMKIGAVDYLSKPFDVDELLSLIEEVLDEGAKGRNHPTHVSTFEHRRPESTAVAGDFGSAVGQHPVMLDLYKRIDQVAVRDTTILITGESGTGKEVIAREIHRRSPRVGGPFIALNCAAIPETLIESELFGHEKGAFTHAVDRRIGHFELADHGTLFLDEIGELSLNVQVKMLRFLQSQEFYRVGHSKPIHVDVRILAATNRNLATAIEEGSFRQDLFYRINVVSLEMPPLRDRSEDVPRLIEHFIRKLSPLYANRAPSISSDALATLCRYSWPGNVRELENVVESLLALSAADEIGMQDLPTRLRASADDAGLRDQVLGGSIPFEEAERAFERDLIIKALERSDYVQTRAAELLGISRRILKYKMDKLGISQRPSAAAPE